eukprot:Gregarina_sp_Poly_1__4628@NODE_2476_length_2074_cov_296_379173_g1569_i0_p1_GENE_NODE_2476_length_2074_cov_296_379173_g1569_i0NODE_2476_length_2074_cov_296_379173_g1569_i0_p1_ORF_typecomplete_len601_score62_00_NODE_2476_length_2074_cov_296_379173_g1569_i01301932
MRTFLLGQPVRAYWKFSVPSEGSGSKFKEGKTEFLDLVAFSTRSTFAIDQSLSRTNVHSWSIPEVILSRGIELELNKWELSNRCNFPYDYMTETPFESMNKFIRNWSQLHLNIGDESFQDNEVVVKPAQIVNHYVHGAINVAVDGFSFEEITELAWLLGCICGRHSHNAATAFTQQVQYRLSGLEVKLVKKTSTLDSVDYFHAPERPFSAAIKWINKYEEWRYLSTLAVAHAVVLTYGPVIPGFEADWFRTVAVQRWEEHVRPQIPLDTNLSSMVTRSDSDVSIFSWDELLAVIVEFWKGFAHVCENLPTSAVQYGDVFDVICQGFRTLVQSTTNTLSLHRVLQECLNVTKSGSCNYFKLLSFDDLALSFNAILVSERLDPITDPNNCLYFGQGLHTQGGRWTLNHKWKSVAGLSRNTFSGSVLRGMLFGVRSSGGVWNIRELGEEECMSYVKACPTAILPRLGNTKLYALHAPEPALEFDISDPLGSLLACVINKELELENNDSRGKEDCQGDNSSHWGEVTVTFHGWNDQKIVPFPCMDGIAPFEGLLSHIQPAVGWPFDKDWQEAELQPEDETWPDDEGWQAETSEALADEEETGVF